MGEIRIKIEDESLLTRISDLARLHNRSVEQEVEALLQSALPQAQPSRSEDLRALVDRIAVKAPRGVKQSDVVEMLREDRDR